VKFLKSLSFLILILFTSLSLQSAQRSSQWEHVRKTYLKDHQSCVICGTTKDLQVHHIKPFHLYPELELDPNNFITLCTSKYWGFNCHLIAGHAGNFKWENIHVVEDAARLHDIASPQYIRENGTDERDEYIKEIRKRGKAENGKGGNKLARSAI